MLGKLGRLFRKIQGLRSVGDQLGEVQSRVWWTQAVLEEVVGQSSHAAGGARGTSRRARPGADSVAASRRRAAGRGIVCNEARARRALAVVYEQRLLCDLAKSKLEIPGGLFEEFHEWKARQPLPSEPLVSVCITTYNRAKLLTERSIPSVLKQTYGRLELIVVGDACTDDTEASVARIADPRLTFVNLPTRAVYPEDPTRKWMVAGTQSGNEALSLAKGDFITHLDDDDEYLPVRLEKLVDFATMNRFDFVWHPFWYEQEPGRWLLNDASDLAQGQVTTSSVFYRDWFKRLRWDMDAHLLGEPGDWNLFRRIRFLGPAWGRYPDPLLRHYVERNRSDESVA